MRKRDIHRENCAMVVRDVIEIAETRYVLLGKYAFEWKIITRIDGVCKMTVFKNREEAMKEWKRKKKAASNRK